MSFPVAVFVCFTISLLGGYVIGHITYELFNGYEYRVKPEEVTIRIYKDMGLGESFFATVNDTEYAHKKLEEADWVKFIKEVKVTL